MRAMLVAFAIGALLWTTLGRGDADAPVGPEHTAAVRVDVGSGPAFGTARARQLRVAVGQ